MKNPLVCLFVTALALALTLPFGIDALAQDITGGGVLRDITGGAALIFRTPQNPTVHMSGGQGTLGGGKIKPKSKPPVRQQDRSSRGQTPHEALSSRMRLKSNTNLQRRSLPTMRARSRGWATFMSIKAASPTPLPITSRRLN